MIEVLNVLALGLMAGNQEQVLLGCKGDLFGRKASDGESNSIMVFVAPRNVVGRSVIVLGL